MPGITDPYKLYRHIHPSKVGTCVSNHMGCAKSLAGMSKELLWINLLTSSSGPVKISVSACATTLQSIGITCDIIISNKAKMMIAGGFNDISEEGFSSRSLIFLGCGAAQSAHSNGVPLIMVDVAVVEKIGILQMLAVLDGLVNI
ncbi:hypothetical protein EDC04DRAFT_2601498 [Pisolithus marmoratus]|nr:hypothetical protein EDC04DRAFT_2601498 [Pisolithus marmoratus]